MKREIIECDRCGTLDGGTARRSDWGQAYVATLGGAEVVGTAEAPADLCNNCPEDLQDFMRPGSDETELVNGHRVAREAAE